MWRNERTDVTETENEGMRRVMKKSVLAAMAAVGLSWPGTGGALPLAERGRDAALPIVVSAKASVSEQYAAEELQVWTEKLVGVKPPIITKTDLPKSGNGIFLNDAKTADRLPSLGDEAFELKAEGGSVYVTGGCRGVLYGVYELLEKYGGIAWLTDDFTDIPKKDVFSVPDDLFDRQRPAFVRRCHDWRYIEYRPAFAARSRENHFPIPEKFGGSHPTFDKRLGFCHTFAILIRPNKYFDAHPEYFSYFNGKRQKQDSQLCLTNPDVFRIVVSQTLERVRYNIAMKTGVKYYGISQNDWCGYCECPDCAAIDAREGSHSGSVIWFVNKVAEEVEKVDPNAIVETLAYVYSRHPPKHLRPRHNVMPMLCSIECDFSKPMGENRFKENISFRDDLKEWLKISKHLMVWDYAANWRSTPCPQHNLVTMHENAKFYLENGVTELFFEGWSNDNPCAELSALKGWLSGKLLWNPNQAHRPLVERFVTAYYGKGAPYVLDYIDLLERQPVDETKTPFLYRTYIQDMPWSQTFLKESQDLWHKAVAAVKDGSSPQIASNVFWGAFCADYTRLATYVHKGCRWKPFLVSRSVAKSLDRCEYEEMRALAARLTKIIDANPLAEVSSQLNDARMKGYVRALSESVFPEGKAVDRCVIQDWAFLYSNYPPSTTIFRERDASAVDGRVLRAKKAGRDWPITFNFKNMVAMDDGGTYHLRARMKVFAPEGTPSGQSVASVELNDRNANRDVVQSEIVASGDYRWYDLGTWKAKGDNYMLYINSHDAELFLDCVELTRED